MTTATPDLAPPTPEDLLAARQFIASCYPRTPLRPLHEASLAGGRELYLKCEDEAEIKSFKGRGALWRLACLGERNARNGVITASTGNHGQGVAYAAAQIGVRSVVVVPTGSSPLKMDRIRGFGAELRVSGADIGEASQAAREAALAEDLVYVEDGEDPELIGGEGLERRSDFLRLLDGGIDIVQPDVGICGGIGEGCFVAELAALYGRACVPHAWGGAILIAATL